MSRRAKTQPTVRREARIPETIVAQVDLRLMDPVRGRAKYSAWSDLITTLLKDWLEQGAEDGRPSS